MKHQTRLYVPNCILFVLLILGTTSGASAHLRDPMNKRPSFGHRSSQDQTERLLGAINLALNKPATVSSIENARYKARNAVDGNLSTNWTSETGHAPEWLQIDLGNTYVINGVSLYWEKAYATSYQVQVSIDQTTWTSISSTTTGVGGNTILIGLAGIGHYLRVYATRYSPGHRSFSLEEVQVYGNGAGPQGPTGATGPQGSGTTGATGPQGPQGLSAPVCTEFSTGLTSDGYPYGITSGPGGNLWFITVAKIGYITPFGVVTEFGKWITSNPPFSITSGPDGNLWFTEVDRIGRITPAGVVTEFRTGINAEPYHIIGADGNLWFTEGNQNTIGYITPAGVVTEFSAGITAKGLYDLTVEPDGNLWFTEGDDKIGRITPAGVVTEFSAGITANSGIEDIAAGPDGNLWFTENSANRIGRITPAGVVTEFSAGITANSSPLGITAARDGNLWFTELNGNRIGIITTTGVITEISLSNSNARPYAITAGPEGNIWFTDTGTNQIGRCNVQLA